MDRLREIITTQSLFTMGFHDSSLNSTIWSDGNPTSSKLLLWDDPLVAQLQLTLLSDAKVSVPSVLPGPTTLARFAI
jgi:hypothetical protein